MPSVFDVIGHNAHNRHNRHDHDAANRLNHPAAPHSPAAIAAGLARAAAALRARQPAARPVGLILAPARQDAVRLVFLSVSYRLPYDLCCFVSREMYGGLLDSGRAAPLFAAGPR